MTDNAAHRPPLYRSDYQPNLLEYIDTRLNELYSLNLPLIKTISNKYDQFGNTILDQYLLYLLCQKLNPNKLNPLINELYNLLHRLIILNGKISKSSLEYSPTSTDLAFYQVNFNGYTNFIWNEINVCVLLEIGCFLLKYRLHDIFDTNGGNTKTNNNLTRQKLTGYFLEMIGVYYLSSNHRDYFVNSRSTDMIFPSPSVYSFLPSANSLFSENDEQETFHKFLNAIHDNGEIHFEPQYIRILLQTDAYKFLNKKLENKKFDFMHFLQANILHQQRKSCRTLKSLCRLSIKMHINQYPNDIKQLKIFPFINNQLYAYLTYDNRFYLESSA